VFDLVQEAGVVPEDSTFPEHAVMTADYEGSPCPAGT
jgi:hypothetical protein